MPQPDLLVALSRWLMQHMTSLMRSFGSRCLKTETPQNMFMIQILQYVL